MLAHLKIAPWSYCIFQNCKKKKREQIEVCLLAQMPTIYVMTENSIKGIHSKSVLDCKAHMEWMLTRLGGCFWRPAAAAAAQPPRPPLASRWSQLLGPLSWASPALLFWPGSLLHPSLTPSKTEVTLDNAVQVWKRIIHIYIHHRNLTCECVICSNQIKTLQNLSIVFGFR